MKALSLRQPWAELILNGKKSIETRKWNTKFRGEFYVHASKTLDLDACKHFKLNPNKLTTGALIGKATLISTKEYTSEKEFRKEQSKHQVYTKFKKPRYGFILKNIKRIKTTPLKGSLNFFKV